MQHICTVCVMHVVRMGVADLHVGVVGLGVALGGEVCLGVKVQAVESGG